MPAVAFEFCFPTKGTKVPAGPEWFYEIKHDGYRMGVERDHDRVRLITKSGHDWTNRYLLIVDAARGIRVAAGQSRYCKTVPSLSARSRVGCRIVPIRTRTSRHAAVAIAEVLDRSTTPGPKARKWPTPERLTERLTGEALLAALAAVADDLDG